MDKLIKFDDFKIYESKKTNLIFNEKSLRETLNLPVECKVEIKNGEVKSGKYNKYIKYIITKLPSPVDSNREKIIKKIKSIKEEDIYSSAKPNFGSGVNWIIKFTS